MSKKTGKYYDILTTEGAEEATMMLYGYIGEEYSYDPQRGWEKTGITDIDFVREFEALAEAYPTVHLRIHSPGGEIWHGAAIVNSILNAKCEVHTWCDGVCASMAAGIWAAGKKRHMAKNGMLMFHAGSNICWGTAKDMRDTADALDMFTGSIAAGMAEGLGLSVAEVSARYFDDYADHWLDYSLAKSDGLLTDEADDYAASAKVPTNLAAMNYKQLLASFEEKKTAEARPGLLRQARNAFAQAIAALVGPPDESITNTITDTDMTLQQFKAAIADGSLNVDDVQAALAEMAPKPEPENPAIAALTAKMAAMEATIADQAAKITAWGQTPGAGRTVPNAPAADAPGAGETDTPAARLAAANARMAAAADSGDILRVVDSI